MKKQIYFFTHSVSLCALFILGDACMSLPVNGADNYSFTGYLTAVLLAFIIYFACVPLADFVFGEPQESRVKKIISALFCAVIAVFALWCAAGAFGSFCEFVAAVLLPDTPKAIAVITFLFTVLFFASRRQEDILKFCLLAFSFIAAAVLFFFIATAHNYNLRNIFIFRLPTFKNLILQTKPYFLNPVLPSLLLPFYQVLVFSKKRKGALFTGLFLGAVTLGLCVLSSILLFGAQLAGKMDYPYAGAVSTVTIGRLFTRMDGFSYFIYFASSLTKITVCSFVMYSAIKRLRKLFF